jgi:hypothetical protein
VCLSVSAVVGMGSAQDLDLRIDGKRITRFRVGGEAQGTPGPMTWNGEIVGDTPYELYMHAADAGLEARATVTAGEHLVSASFVEAPWEPEGVQQPLQVDFGRGSDEQFDGVAAVGAAAGGGVQIFLGGPPIIVSAGRPAEAASVAAGFEAAKPATSFLDQVTGQSEDACLNSMTWLDRPCDRGDFFGFV